MTTNEPAVISFRSDKTLQISLLVIGVLGAGMLVVAIFQQHTTSDVIAALVMTCTLWAGSSLPFNSRVDLFSDRLELVNPWGTRVIPTHQIDLVSGKQFLTVRTRDGVDRIAWAVQGSNLSVAQGRETRVGRVASEITEAIAQQPLSGRPTSRVRWRWAPPPWPFIAGELVLIVLGVVAYRRVG